MGQPAASRSHYVLSQDRFEVNLPDDLQALHQEYRTAKPYPHLVVDNLFPAAMLEAVLADMSRQSDATWIDEHEEHFAKKNLRSAVDLEEESFQLFARLHSAPFLLLLSELTGIRGLLPDPYLTAAGPTIMPPGGKFDIHADRNTDHYSGLRRRVVMLVYLNKDWDPAYGGQLEIWDKTATTRVRAIDPIFNRAVFFEIDDTHFHAVRPVTPGCGRDRRSLTVYYHTVDLSVVKHNSIYAPNPYRERESLIRRVAREACPPILHRSWRRLRGK